MRAATGLLLLATLAAGQGMPPPSFVDTWHSSHNQKRLALDWDLPPDRTPIKLPDGTEEPRKAPWPFLLYIVQETDSKSNAKLQEKVFRDTRFILAARAVRLVKIKPDKAIDLPYLASVTGIKDPTIVVVDREFNVVGALKTHKEFNANDALALMTKAADAAYSVKLAAWISGYVDLLEDGEKLWKEEQEIEKLTTKAGEKDPAKRKQLDKEVAEREKELATRMAALEEKDRELLARLALKEEKKEALPTTVGTGKEKRKLTPEELEAIETFREFARDPNPVVRAAAVEDLGAIDSPVMVDQVLEAVNDVDPRVVDAGGKALGRMRSPESLEAMVAGLGHGNAKARQAALLGFSRLERPYPAAAPHLAKFLKDGNEDVRRAAIEAIRNQKDAAAGASLVPLLDDREPALRVMAATALGELRTREAALPLCERLQASDWSLKKASAEALGSIRAKESIEPLLQRFEAEEGLMLEVLYKSLVAVTGQDFSYKPANWRKWWDKWGTGFVLPTDQQIEEAKKKAEKALEGYYDPNKRKYHKIETLSKKMIFVVDISSSMANKIVIPPDAPPEVQAEYPDRVKMEIAKKELIDLLATLDGSVYFNIIPYAGKVMPWKDGLVSGSTRTAAIKFVSKLKPLEAASGGKDGKSSGGGDEQKTNTYGALLAAFGLQDQSVPDWKARTQVDTIFLVTDGMPTTGEIVEVPKLVEAITQLNKSRGIVIHLITFGKLEAQRLSEIATKNGGQVVVRGF